jgi:hypothetical protein
MYQLIDDKSGFFDNKSTITEAYRDGTLYGLKVCETDEMYRRGDLRLDIFCTDTLYLLPCFCIKKNDAAIIIWTHSRARNMGFGRKMVELLDIKRADTPLKESLGFWKKCNISTD